MFKLTPILLLAILILKFDIIVASFVATIYASILALFYKFTPTNITDAILNNLKNMQMVFFILMLAYAMAEIFMISGVGACIISIGLKAGITARSVAVFALIITALASISTGSSWGTFAGCAPIFLWLNHILGGNVSLTLCAIAGGACFGDNLGLTSDTTIISSGIQEVDILDRIKHQGYWSLITLIISAILFYIASLNLSNEVIKSSDIINLIPQTTMNLLNEKSPEAIKLITQIKNGVPLFMCLPLIFVLIFAFLGFNTIICLIIGLLSSSLLGLFSNNISSISEIFKIISAKFSTAGSSGIVMMMWIIAFGGVMKLINAFDMLANFIKKIARNIKELMFYNGLLSLFGTAVLADAMAQIVTIGPVIKDITKDCVDANKKEFYTLRLRNATFSDALGVFGSQLIPWHGFVLYFIFVARSVYPLYDFSVFDVIKYNFLAMICVSSILLLTLSGFDRFIPNFSLPNVKLK